jgi:hypothetical protein
MHRIDNTFRHLTKFQSLVVALLAMVCSVTGQAQFKDDGRLGSLCGRTPPNVPGGPVWPDARADFVVWPVGGSVTADPVAATFGPRVLSGSYDFHGGIDMSATIPPTAPCPDPSPIVRAALDGKVVRKHSEAQAIPTPRFGNWVMLRHADTNDIPPVRRYTAYLHLQSFLVNLGDNVRAGDPIGIMGMSGRDINTCHVHFERYENLNDVCGVFLKDTLSPFGLPLPVIELNAYQVQLGRIRGQISPDEDRIILRTEIPKDNLDVVEFRIASDREEFGIDLNRKIGVAPDEPSGTMKCCDQALTSTTTGDHIVQLMPNRFTGQEPTYGLCIDIGNADAAATYNVSLINARAKRFDFGPFRADDPPADVSDCNCSPSCCNTCLITRFKAKAK